MSNLSVLEQDLLRMFLEGDDPVLAILREQLRVATISERRMTGVGFYTNFSVPIITARVLENPSFEVGDVAAQIQGVQHGTGFLLFVRNGTLSFLEGFTYDEPWPQTVTSYKVNYINGQRQWDCIRKVLHPA